MYIDDTIIAGILTVVFVLAFFGGLGWHIMKDIKQTQAQQKK